MKRYGTWETTNMRDADGQKGWLEQANDPENEYRGQDLVPTLILFAIMGILVLCYLAMRFV